MRVVTQTAICVAHDAVAVKDWRWRLEAALPGLTSCEQSPQDAFKARLDVALGSLL